MASRIRSVVLRFVIVVSTMLGLVLPPSHASPSHNRISPTIAEAWQPVDLPTEVLGTEQAHKEGSRDEQAPGHPQGHNPFDHSHETPSIPPGLSPVMRAQASGWLSTTLTYSHRRFGSRLDRPPKAIFIA